MSRRGFHVLGLRVWPFATSISILGLVYTILGWINGFREWAIILMFRRVTILSARLVFWWGDVIKEGLYLGCHTSLVVRGFRLGIIFFLLSEGAFFFSFFWAFVYFKIGTESEGIP